VSYKNTYQEAVDYILKIPKFTTKNDLNHTRVLLQFLGNPQEKLKIIHVAGTNGKGSVCVYLDSILQAEGKTVGRFTSPHLERINERIVINGQEICDEAFLESFALTLAAVREMEKLGYPHPTFFEFVFGMSMLSFAKEKVEYGVLETGLGGRLDATNAVESPLITIITSIGFDHMEQLGNTLEKIATEKAGIIKKGVPLIFAQTSKESDTVMEKGCDELNSPCYKVRIDDYKIVEKRDNSLAFSITNSYYGDKVWYLSNSGIYQPHNALLALEAARLLFGDHGKVEKWKLALENVVWPGRMEEILPDIFLDSAHNATAIQGFVESIYKDAADKIIIFAVASDKDYEGMIYQLATKLKVEKYIVTRIAGARGVDPCKIRDLFEKYTDTLVIIKEAPIEAFKYAKKLLGDMRKQHRKGAVYIVGSMYLIGEIKEEIRKC